MGYLSHKLLQKQIIVCRCAMVNTLEFLGSGSSFTEQMVEYIKKHFADLLCEDAKLLDQPSGLDMIGAKYGLGTARGRNDA